MVLKKFKEFNELFQYKDLLTIWTQREIRIRYKQTFLGGAWAVLQPLALMVIFSIVFGYFVNVPTDGIPYPLFSYSALLPWTFFTTTITFASVSLISNMNLLTKVYFPREVFPIAALGAAFLDFVIASILFIFLMFIYRVDVSITILWFPVLVIMQVLLMLGISFFTSATIVFYRDVRFIVPLLLQIWLFLTPVVYPLSIVPEKFLPLYMLNPMAGLIDSYRRITIMGQAPQWNFLALNLIIILLIFIFGYILFKRVEHTFADII
jgi:lipopolysaccharide transport system permease protein